MRRSLLIFWSILLLTSVSSTGLQAADTSDAQYVFKSRPTTTALGVQFTDGIFANSSVYLPPVSYLVANVPVLDASGHPTGTLEPALCGSVDDVSCHAGGLISYVSHFPRCENQSQLDCIDSVFAVKPDGTKIIGTYMAGLTGDVSNPFTGNSSLGIPTPADDGVWEIPGAINGGGSDTYSVTLTATGFGSKLEGQSLSNPIPIAEFNAGISPVKLVEGSFQPPKLSVLKGGDGVHFLSWTGIGGIDSQFCVIASKTQCGLHESFPPDLRFGLSLRFSQAVRGWLHGRVRDPDITLNSSSTATSLTVEALPVAVPIVDAWTEPSALPSSILRQYYSATPPPISVNAWAWGSGMTELLKTWLPIIGSTAQAQPTEWMVRSLSSSEMQGTDACMAGASGLAGVVTTNSTVYSAGPPKFNADTQSLDYTLVSPHFTSIGSIFKGVYTLAIKADVARCIYHFTNAPIKATISITDDSGDSSVAVESVAEHDGWIYLSATNFEFSSPTVHVKLSQDAPVAKPSVMPSPTATLKPQASPTPLTTITKIKPQKKLTILCTKGKSVKKVSANKPVCPKGYKRMAV